MRALTLASVSTLAVLSLSSADAKFTTLYSFAGGSDGSGSEAALIMDRSGNLYGTTAGGGVHGIGTVFKLARDGTETVLHAFAGGSDGAYPAAGLMLGKDGNLYGTTPEGGGDGCGGSGCGTVFSVAPDGTETVLYAFKGGAIDGSGPFWGVFEDHSGNLYGTTTYGPGAGCALDQGCGTVFKLTPDGTERVLYALPGGDDGGNPNSNLIRDASGNLYAAAMWGGSGNDGVLFKLDRSGAETVLHRFSYLEDTDTPAGLSMDTDGNLYTTVQGGRRGHGAVFRLAPDGTGKLVYSFKGGRKDGDTSLTGVILDSGQNLYGTTIFGGGNGCGGLGCGTVFKIAPDGTETVLHIFTDAAGGTIPSALIRDNKGFLYGTTYRGGAHGFGMIFRLSE
jgi:uncharacterized repeat protein (TIGR03803 family)